MDASRLAEVHRAAFPLGDCEDAIGPHHGTPRQRQCASNCGANLALTSYLDGGRVASPSELRRTFDEKYRQILDLEEDRCEAAVDANLLDEAIYGEIVGSGSKLPSREDAPPPAADASRPEYAPYAPPRSEYEPFDPKPQVGWEYGTAFDAYDPGEGSSSSQDELDRRTPRVQNGMAYDEGRGWFGDTQSQWRMPRSDGMRSDNVGSTLIAVLAVLGFSAIIRY